MKTNEQKIQDAIEMYDFSDQAEVAKALEGGEVIFSCYETGSYEGGWGLAYIDREGNLMYDEGSHCSCNGPSFSPSPTTPEELLKKEPYLCALEPLRAAVRARFPATLNWRDAQAQAAAKHPEELVINGMTVTPQALAKALCALRYDALFTFFKAIEHQLHDDAEADRKRGRVKLAAELLTAGQAAGDLKNCIMTVWQVCQSFVRE